MAIRVRTSTAWSSSAFTHAHIHMNVHYWADDAVERLPGKVVTMTMRGSTAWNDSPTPPMHLHCSYQLEAVYYYSLLTTHYVYQLGAELLLLGVE